MSSPQNRLNLDNVLQYLRRYVSAASYKFYYIVLLFYYAYRNSDTPSWARNIILGTVAYILNPIDAIPDLTPFIGMTDDLGVISFALVTIACYIDEDVRNQAKEYMLDLSGESQNLTNLMEEVNEWL